MQKITTFLWFDKEAEEAARFYCSIFPDSKILTTARYPEGGPGPAGSVMTVEFQLAGQRFMALNGGPTFKFTEAISLMVDCETQKELDACWDKLSAGGREVECGWLKDRYGLSWQIVPSGIGKMISDPKRGPKVAEAVWKMKKLDIAALRRAYESA
ncbi:MAG TPA: VOC family protein [Myxococcales bacterium]|nr:VOC family protein [Myxococcales bacterium]